MSLEGSFSNDTDIVFKVASIRSFTKSFTLINRLYCVLQFKNEKNMPKLFDLIAAGAVKGLAEETYIRKYI